VREPNPATHKKKTKGKRDRATEKKETMKRRKKKSEKTTKGVKGNNSTFLVNPKKKTYKGKGRKRPGAQLDMKGRGGGGTGEIMSPGT